MAKDDFNYQNAAANIYETGIDEFGFLNNF